jgi:hypothetical protein
MAFADRASVSSAGVSSLSTSSLLLLRASSLLSSPLLLLFSDIQRQGEIKLVPAHSVHSAHVQIKIFFSSRILFDIFSILYIEKFRSSKIYLGGVIFLQF